MKKVAKILEISDMEVYEVSSFYTMYNRERVGKFHLQICGTTPCQLCGSRELTKAIEKYTGATLGHTSPDGLWTIEEVECLGACANAPMIQVETKFFILNIIVLFILNS
jgi:NADH dehydrogenase (ubiquinone) flavoprotein 2